MMQLGSDFTQNPSQKLGADVIRYDFPVSKNVCRIGRLMRAQVVGLLGETERTSSAGGEKRSYVTVFASDADNAVRDELIARFHHYKLEIEAVNKP
jgi:hypothetical protein